jgi:hypothetical protein
MSYSGALMGFGRGYLACRRVGLGRKKIYEAIILKKRGLLTESYARGPSSVSLYTIYELIQKKVHTAQQNILLTLPFLDIAPLD